jgi:hypothetical protein
VSPSATRAATSAVLGMRIAYGIGLIVAPSRLGRPWLGPASATAPTQVPLQALGAREIVWHTGAAIALARDRPLRPWLAGSVIGDLTDVAATLAGRRQLPKRSVLATVLVGGASAMAGVAVAVANPS